MSIPLTMFADRRVRIPLAVGVLMGCGAVARLAAVNIAILNAGYFSLPAPESTGPMVTSPAVHRTAPSGFFAEELPARDAAIREVRVGVPLARVPAEPASVSPALVDLTKPIRVWHHPTRLDAGTLSRTGEPAEWRYQELDATNGRARTELPNEWLVPRTAG